MDYFVQLTRTLLGEGYEVRVVRYKDKDYRYAWIEGKGIEGGFCSEHSKDQLWASYPDVNGKIAVDHTKCFDKWSKCPMVLPIPKTKDQMIFLLNQLAFWGTDRGSKLSCQYEFDQWIDDYPDYLREGNDHESPNQG